jgi:hypothetical protein
MKCLPKKIGSVLKLVYLLFSKNKVKWILSGSVSLCIQGVTTKKIHDIDILASKKETEKIDRLLSDFRIKKLRFNSTPTYRSHFAIYIINGVRVELMGNFQYKLKNGHWSKPNQKNKKNFKEFAGMQLPVLPLTKELTEYKNTGRQETVKAINNALKAKAEPTA